MITLTADTGKFNDSLAKLIYNCRINAVKVVKTEAGAMVKTLVRISPPVDLNRTKKAIAKKLRGKFQAASNSSLSDGAAHREGEIIWYHWNPHELFGVGRGLDKRNDSIEELRKLALTLTKGGRQKLPFLHPRRHQTVLIRQTILATKDQITGVVKRFWHNIGRLKAAWTTPWNHLGIKGDLPQYVKNNMPGARGRFLDGLGVPDFPTFSIANSAKGISDKKVLPLIRSALRIRAKAMAQNAALIMRGVKEASEYGA